MNILDLISNLPIGQLLVSDATAEILNYHAKSEHLSRLGSLLPGPSTGPIVLRDCMVYNSVWSNWHGQIHLATALNLITPFQERSGGMCTNSNSTGQCWCISVISTVTAVTLAAH